MFMHGDIALIIGKNNSGKTIFSRYLASTLDPKYIYIDFIHTSYERLDEIYNTYNNQNKKIVLLFDNYIEMTKNMRRMNLFFYSNKFTLIFVMNYISHKMIKKSDVIYFSKDESSQHIYFNSISKYYKNKNKFITKMNKLRSYGFLSIDKDNKVKHKEELIKIN
jgi:hypothetical protein